MKCTHFTEAKYTLYLKWGQWALVARNRQASVVQPELLEAIYNCNTFFSCLRSVSEDHSSSGGLVEAIYILKESRRPR